MKWLRIELPDGRCGAVSVNSFGFVLQTAPVFGWMWAKHESVVRRWVLGKKGKVEWLESEPNESGAKPTKEVTNG